MGVLVKQTCERFDLQTFFRSLGARYKRIRKRPRETPSPQLIELKVLQLQELANLWKTGYIDLFFGDESHVCTSGYVPYGWQFPQEEYAHNFYQENRKTGFLELIAKSWIIIRFSNRKKISWYKVYEGFLRDFYFNLQEHTVVCN